MENINATTKDYIIVITIYTVTIFTSFIAIVN